MKNVLVFAGSNSKKSINKALAVYAGSQLENVNLNVIDLNDFPLPIYGIDLEQETGIPENVKRFDALINSSDAIVVSLAEHNGSYTAAYKNTLDWLSRLEPKPFRNKPMLLLSTSPGGRGGMNVMNLALGLFPRQGAEIIANYSLPSFNDHFKDGNLVAEVPELAEAIKAFQKAL